MTISKLSHITTAPGTSVSECVISMSFTATLLSTINEEKASLQKQSIFAQYFRLPRWSCGACVKYDVGEKLERKKNPHRLLFKLRNILSCWLLRVSSVTRAFTHWDTSHKHRSKESNACTSLALEPQQSAAVLMGATCCYCGLCGEAGLLPVLQPPNEPSTLTVSHMVHRPLGHSLPVCPAVSGGFNHSSFWLQLWAPTHSVRISDVQQRCHTLRLSGRRGRQSHVFGTGSRSCHRHIAFLSRFLPSLH